MCICSLRHGRFLRTLGGNALSVVSIFVDEDSNGCEQQPLQITVGHFDGEDHTAFDLEGTERNVCEWSGDNKGGDHGIKSQFRVSVITNNVSTVAAHSLIAPTAQNHVVS